MKDAIPKDLMAILACPMCKGDLKLSSNTLFCKKCDHLYPIKDGIAILLPPEEK